ncbi:MAG: hypothetical protein R3E32_03370 [Chitinophagales bacterium]
MKKYVLICSYWLSFMVFSACSSKNPSIADASTANYYFSLKQFFQSQIQSFQSQQIVLHKFASLNGELEKKALSEIDWETEFRPFVNSDINKPAWKDSYQIDSSANGLGQLQVHYTAMNPDLRTQKIDITFGKDAVTPSFIEVTNLSRNPIYDTTEKLQYDVNKRYVIENEQKVMWMKPDAFKIEGELIFYRERE